MKAKNYFLLADTGFKLFSPSTLMRGEKLAVSYTNATLSGTGLNITYTDSIMQGGSMNCTLGSSFSMKAPNQEYRGMIKLN
tara:strand:+ start:107 stop:349 length:243 start_codon:yes stop_codon:yes gene_type:complete